MAKIDSYRGTQVLYTRFVWEPVIREVLNRAGVEIDRKGQQSQVLSSPRMEPLQQFDPIDRTLLQTVQQHEAALVRYEANNVDLSRLIAQVALAWPDKTVTVVVPEREDAWALSHALRGYLPDVSVLTGQTSPAEVGRVVVSTY